MKKKLSKLVILILPMVFIAGAVFSQANMDRFKRQKVAVVPSDDGVNYTRMVKAALGKDKRFELIDKKHNKEILKEWARRQSGITESDDTDDLTLKNVHFFVKLTDIAIFSKYIIPKSKKQKPYWETQVKGNIVVIKVQEGGQKEVGSVSSSATGRLERNSKIDAVNNLQGSINTAVKKLFPIQAQVYKASFNSVQLLRGSDSGVAAGQRYILKREKRVKDPFSGEMKYITEDIGFVQVSKANDKDSQANMIMSSGSFNPQQERVVAKEKYYYDASFELWGGMMMYDTDIEDHMAGDFDARGGFKILAGIVGGDFLEIGWGMNFGMCGDYLNYSLTDLNLRMNIHLVRRLSFFVDIMGSVEFASINTAVITVGQPIPGQGVDLGDGNYRYDDYKAYASTWQLSGTASAGLKFVIGQHVYAYGAVAYTLAGDFSEFSMSDPNGDDFEGGENSDEFTVRDVSVQNYDKYLTEKISSGGLKIYAGVGLNF